MSRPLSVIGYLFEPTGMGEHMRSVVRGLRAGGLTPRLVDVADHRRARDPDFAQEFEAELSEGIGALNLFCVNGDEAGRVIQRLGADRFATARNIVYPAWELARYPAAWARTLERFDEVWAPSTFVRDAIASTLDRPVLHFPLPVEPRLSAFLGRRRFGISEDAFAVLFFFDFASYAERKNPAAVLDAFEQLAARRPQAQLHCVIKTRGAAQDPQALAAVQTRVAALGGRAQLIHADLSDNEIKNLVRNCDAFVSLHRSEGFGRGMAEAMALGRPAMGTAYSGNLDFMTPETALLVDYELVPVAPGAYPHGAGQVWAEPSAAHAARLLEGLLDDPDAARALGARAQAHIRLGFSNRAVGLRYAERLEALG